MVDARTSRVGPRPVINFFFAHLMAGQVPAPLARWEEQISGRLFLLRGGPWDPGKRALLQVLAATIASTRPGPLRDDGPRLGHGQTLLVPEVWQDRA